MQVILWIGWLGVPWQTIPLKGCCGLKMFGNHCIREAGLSPLSKLDGIWKVCLSVSKGTDYCSSLYSFKWLSFVYRLSRMLHAFCCPHYPNFPSLCMLNQLSLRQCLKLHISLSYYQNWQKTGLKLWKVASNSRCVSF